MKPAGGASSLCIRTDLGETLPANQTACGIAKCSGKDLFGAVTCPVQEDVVKVSPSMQTVVEAGAWTGESASTTGW